MDRIELENGSVIETIDNAGDSIRSKRGQEYFKKIEEIYIKQLLEETINCYSTSSTKAFTLDDFQKAIDNLSQLPPVANKIEIGTFALNVLLEKIPTIDNTKFKELPNTMYGLPIEIYEGYDLKFNQMRVKYSNGESKVIDVFEYNCDNSMYKYIFREDI
jgi:hypothetical protein